MYQFKLPVGDWDYSGHRKCDWFLVQSSHPLEEVREAYFQAVAFRGTSPEEVCSKYLDNRLVIDQLKNLGIPAENILYYTESIPTFPELGSVNVVEDSTKFAELVLEFIQRYNSKIELQLIEEDMIPVFSFKGRDKFGRSFSNFGYGLFD